MRVGGSQHERDGPPVSVRFVLTGTTGTGKTSTVLQLFGHNNDLEGLGAKTSDRASETRFVTVQFGSRLHMYARTCLEKA